MKFSIKHLFYLFVLTLLFQNCGQEKGSSKASENSVNAQSKANFLWINENIVQPQCIECHHGSFEFAGLNFTSYEGVMDAIEPGAPDASPFYTRSFTTTFFELTSDEREIIRIWITSGAQ